MSKEVNVKEILNQSTADVPLSMLAKKGFKQVKVLNKGVINELIEQAVAKVIESRSGAISREEAQQIQEQARTEFKKVLAKVRSDEQEIVATAKKAQTERDVLAAEVEKLRKQTAEVEKFREQWKELSGEIDKLKSRAAEADGLRSERDGLARELEAKNHELESQATRVTDNSALENEKNQLSVALQSKGAECAELEKTIARMEGEMKALREAADKGGLAGALQELLELKGQQQQQANAGELGEIKSSIDKLLTRISHGVALGGGGAISIEDDEAALNLVLASVDDAALESNMGEVTVKDAKAKGGVSSTLEKLRSLKGGGKSE